MDVDSTLIQGEVIEMLAAHAGCADEVAADHRGRDARRAGLRRVAAGPGAPARRARRGGPRRRTPRPAARPRAPARSCAPSSGSTTGSRSSAAASPRSPTRLVAELGIDYAAANTLEIVDGRLTGELVGPVVDRAGKAAALEQFAAEAGVPLAQTVAIGDGANDLDMLAVRRPRHRVQRQAPGPRGRRRRAQRALPGRDPVPARHLPRGVEDADAAEGICRSLTPPT